MSNVHEASIFFREAAGTGDWWYSEWLCRVCVARHYSSSEHLQVSPSYLLNIFIEEIKCVFDNIR